MTVWKPDKVKFERVSDRINLVKLAAVSIAGTAAFLFWQRPRVKDQKSRKGGEGKRV
ncbi:MAG: hypothetical protein ACYSSI_00430 [Planctomycetota bacterium]|jgi:hypothetical protein